MLAYFWEPLHDEERTVCRSSMEGRPFALVSSRPGMSWSRSMGSLSVSISLSKKLWNMQWTAVGTQMRSETRWCNRTPFMMKILMAVQLLIICACRRETIHGDHGFCRRYEGVAAPGACLPACFQTLKSMISSSCAATSARSLTKSCDRVLAINLAKVTWSCKGERVLDYHLPFDLISPL